MWKSNVLLGLVTAGISIYVLVHSLGLQYRVGFGPGPAFAPRWIAIFLLAVSILYVGANLIRRDESEAFPMTLEALGRSGGMFIAFGAAILLIEPLGFTIAMALFLIVVLKVFEGQTWLFSLAVGVISALAVFGLFALVFDVPLPRLMRGLF